MPYKLRGAPRHLQCAVKKGQCAIWSCTADDHGGTCLRSCRGQPATKEMGILEDAQLALRVGPDGGKKGQQLPSPRREALGDRLRHQENQIRLQLVYLLREAHIPPPRGFEYSMGILHSVVCASHTHAQRMPCARKLSWSPVAYCFASGGNNTRQVRVNHVEPHRKRMLDSIKRQSQAKSRSSFDGWLGSSPMVPKLLLRAQQTCP